ncbi:hypothetical protein PROFUN_01369 [Planoprotostelium fungivorum]|uniref:Uncharacterized protein n=1 Tax=Planoprotostelium fungivorum TaxID=1890364 RepID=A0A2P6NT15_9EUKA|nr:hypothetical protein PROFUN_01369 [Planoprotostelium fungivorum]
MSGSKWVLARDHSRLVRVLQSRSSQTDGSHVRPRSPHWRHGRLDGGQSLHPHPTETRALEVEGTSAWIVETRRLTVALPDPVGPFITSTWSVTKEVATVILRESWDRSRKVITTNARMGGECSTRSTQMRRKVILLKNPCDS